MKIEGRPLTVPSRTSATPSSTPAEPPATPTSQGWAAKTNRSRPAAGLAPSSTDGRAFCESALLDIKARSARGEKVRVVFDVDDTLSESRARTLAVAKDWDRANGTSYFSRLVVAQVGQNGTETAKAMGLPDEVVTKFQAHWDVEFWKGERFVHDTPIGPTVELAKKARAAGAEVIFLTGRVEELEGATIAQLQRFGLSGVDGSTVVSKADLSVRTAAFKTQWLTESAEAGHHLAFFITESRRDVAAIQQGVTGAPTVLVASAFSGETAVDPSTPIFPLR